MTTDTEPVSLARAVIFKYITELENEVDELRAQLAEQANQ